jgi:nucleoside-diphosphate-sugar epimerase
MQGKEFNIQNPTSIRDFVYIEEVCEKILEIISNPPLAHGNAEIGTGVGTSLLDCAIIAADILKVDHRLVKTTYAFTEKKSQIIIRDSLHGLGKCNVFLREGLEQTISQM